MANTHGFRGKAKVVNLDKGYRNMHTWPAAFFPRRAAVSELLLLLLAEANTTAVLDT
jgi:hypothetical protein